MHSNMQARSVNPVRRNFASLSAALAVGLALVFSTAGCSTLNATGSSAEARTKQKVVFQVSDPDPKKWNLALNNLKNVQSALGKDNVDAELVVYGPGIGMLKLESVAGNRVNDAVKSGVKVVACENTMHNMKLTKADMLSSIDYVPGGVIELMKLQEEGYAYIRP